VLFVVNTLVSQSFGQRNYVNCGRYLWQGVWFALLFGVVTLLMYPFAERLFLLMKHEPRMAALEAEYFRVVVLAGPVKLASVALAQFMLGIHRPVFVFVGALGGVFTNVFFNWLLIYGNWGFPALGVAGAAWGTNAAVVVELLVMALYLSRPRVVREFNTLDTAFRPDLFRTLLRIGLPAGFQLICDILAWTVFMNVIIAQFGTAALSANSFAFTYMHVCFMPAIGVGAAVTALVGKYIGMGRPDLAERRAHLGFFVCATYMVLCGAVLAFFSRPLLSIFTSDPHVQDIGQTLMYFVAAYQIFDAMFVTYVGALRGAGDTLAPAVVQAGLVWTIVVLGGALTVHYTPQYGVAGPWTLATFFGSVLGMFLLTRFLHGRWKSIRLDHAPALDRVGATA
jgi:MATE family multidrug resistance protein